MLNLKVAVLGCGGIIGQHMMISVPEGVDPLFVRKHPFPLSTDLDLEDWDATREWLNREKPDVVVNLAGESRPDVVEREPDLYRRINSGVPALLAAWSDNNESHLIHVSSQSVLSGELGSYKPNSLTGVPVNEYGLQKAAAESAVETSSNWTVVRPTFVLGIRPFPALGRENPAESILGSAQKWQVNNRWFSVSFAWDVAEMLWNCALLQPKTKIIHCGNPECLSRYELARLLNPAGDFEPVTHKHLATEMPLAERPLNTTYRDASFETALQPGLERLREEFISRTIDSVHYRAKELGAFLRRPWNECYLKLAHGFGPLHNAVSDDFRASEVAPDDDAGLLAWYRSTDAYLWELTAYHCDSGFNYAGTCYGIIARLKADWGPQRTSYRVLCLGDGVGTLTVKMKEADFDAEYHDLYGSRTALFAQTRMAMRFQHDVAFVWSHDFKPPLDAFVSPGNFELYDAVVSLDYLEHVPNVEDWVRVVWKALKPGGLFCAQNAFGIGSGPEGDMPMHLASNDRFEKDWDPLLTRIGFIQEAPQWYRKPL